MPELTDLSVIRALCEKYDFALSKGFGQNFIINPGIPQKIVDVSGVDKRDIVKIAREIGTFDTSILPYEDCCTVFTPRHPKTRPTVAEVAEAESALDIDALVREAVDGIERIRIDL